MVNKLYDEASIQDIANAIREKSGSTDTYTVAQMGPAVRDIQVGGDAADLPYRRYTGEITETVVGSGVYATLLKNDLLKEHRNDKGLMVRVVFDIESTAYTIVQSFGMNDYSAWPFGTLYQYVLRWDASGARNTSTIAVPVNTTSPVSVGCIQITEDGELRVYSNSSSNYAIRPCNYTVEVMWDES